MSYVCKSAIFSPRNRVAKNKRCTVIPPIDLCSARPSRRLHWEGVATRDYFVSRDNFYFIKRTAIFCVGSHSALVSSPADRLGMRLNELIIADVSLQLIIFHMLNLSAQKLSNIAIVTWP